MRINIFINDFKSISRLMCVITIFGVLQFLILTFLAAFLYPGGYDYFGYYFSDLGAIVAKNGEPNPISSMLFFVALSVIAVTFIPFWLIIRSLFTESVNEKILSTLGSALGLISSPFIIGVALFPKDTQLEAHILVTLIFFLMYTIATLLYSVAIFVNHKYPNYFGVIGFVIFIISLLLFMPFMWDLPLGAFLQKVVEYCYFFWVLIPIYLVWSMVEPEKTTLTIQSKMTAA